MEQISIWVTISIGIVIPFVGWIFNTLITNKINDLNTKQREDRQLFFKRMDEEQENLIRSYVRKDIYEQAMTFQEKSNDEKYKGLITVVNNQFKNVEDKIDTTNDKIEDLQNMLLDKLSGSK